MTRPERQLHAASAVVARVSPLGRLLHPSPKATAIPVIRPQQRLGEVLLDMGALRMGALARALDAQSRQQTRLGEMLVARGDISEMTLLRALSIKHGLGFANLAHHPMDPALVNILPVDVAFRTRSVPWMRNGDLLVIATSCPESMAEVRAALGPAAERAVFALAPSALILETLARFHRDQLRARAEAMPPATLSCRTSTLLPTLVWLGALLLVCAAIMAPAAILVLLCIIALASLAAGTALKIAALISHIRARKPRFATRRAPDGDTPHPAVSILVPLFKEADILPSLVERMARLDYPRELLEICIVVEENDTQTRAALNTAALPGWFRVVVVPDGHPRTKPRAMNYALNFARGEIIGIYDAEDAPSPDQIERVAQRFAQASARTVCLQGRLDYYNPRSSWIARCFTIEYATWFRCILPALARMGLPVPLGGTTLFFRRKALEEIGGWDAHNVTEDADLGVRLARAGYRTELIDITTQEEANARAWPWIKQRSRWTKGYIMTWAVHCRSPRALWRDLGARQFFGFQLLFLTSIINGLTTPVLWSLALPLVGLPHPFFDALGPMATKVVIATMLFSSLITLILGVVACSAPHHRFLRVWVPSTLIYFPLATAAALKALSETVTSPFFWDKTMHGAFGGRTHGISNVRPVAPDEQALKPSQVRLQDLKAQRGGLRTVLISRTGNREVVRIKPANPTVQKAHAIAAE